jgi:CRISPR/Cas system-associated endonuclease Cas3-HD
MTCHAFYERRRSGTVREEWRRHSEDSMELFNRCFRRDALVMASRLGLSRDVAEVFARLSVGMHDIGKVLNVYQLQAGFVRRASYYGHEAVGAYMLDQCVIGCMDRGQIEMDKWMRLRLISVAAVMMHHHAMRSLMDWWITLKNAEALYSNLGKWIRIFRVDHIGPQDECIVDSRDVLRRALTSPTAPWSTESVINCYSKCMLDFSYPANAQGIVDLLRGLNHWYVNLTKSTYDRLPREYLLITGPLIIVDNVVAHRNRGGKGKSLMIEELERMCGPCSQ